MGYTMLLKCAGLCITLCTSISYAQPTDSLLIWGFGGDLSEFNSLVEGAPTGAEFQTDWLVQLYRDGQTNSTLNAIQGFWQDGTPLGLSASDDQLLAGFSTQIDIGKGGVGWSGELNLIDPEIDGKSVYTVIFNASAIANAHWALIVDESVFTVANLPPMPEYVPTGVANDWVPVRRLEIQSVALLSNRVAATISARPGTTYALQFTTNLLAHPNGWQEVGRGATNLFPLILEDGSNLPDPLRIYRVQEVP